MGVCGECARIGQRIGVLLGAINKPTHISGRLHEDHGVGIVHSGELYILRAREGVVVFGGREIRPRSAVHIHVFDLSAGSRRGSLQSNGVGAF